MDANTNIELKATIEKQIYDSIMEALPESEDRGIEVRVTISPELAKRIKESYKPDAFERYDVIMYCAQMANGVQLTAERTQKNTDIRMMVAYRMHQEGYTYSEIGKLMSRDHSTVAYWNRCMREMLSLPGAFKNFMGRYEHFNRLLDNEA